MKFESIEAQVLDFAKASFTVIRLKNCVDAAKREYWDAIRNYMIEEKDYYNFSRKDVIAALDDTKFNHLTNELYDKCKEAKKELYNAKRRLETRYKHMPKSIMKMEIKK